MYWKLKHFLYCKQLSIEQFVCISFLGCLHEHADTEGSLLHHLSICLPIWGKVAHVFFGTFLLNIDSESRHFQQYRSWHGISHDIFQTITDYIFLSDMATVDKWQFGNQNWIYGVYSSLQKEEINLNII